MARVSVPAEMNVTHPNDGGRVQKLINLAVTTWHAAFPGGAAVNVTSGFTNPSSAEADRIPELALAGGGTPGDYVITGTWNGEAQSETLTSVAGSSVKGTKPFDTITSVTGPDPVANLTLNKGDSWADPPCRYLYTGSGSANCACQLIGESAVKTITGLPAGLDWKRRVRRVAHTTTTLTAPYFVW